MNITNEWLATKCACGEGSQWFAGQSETDGVKVVKKLLSEDHWHWANWLIVRLMTREQYLAYSIFASEQVISIYEKDHPGNQAPRKAIDAAKTVLAHDTEENRAAADAADARKDMQQKIINYGLSLLVAK